MEELLYIFILLAVRAFQFGFVVLRALWVILQALPPKLRMAVILVAFGAFAHWAVTPYPFGKIGGTKAAAELVRPRTSLQLMPSHVVAAAPVAR
jgi:hypothetical protein